MGTNVRLTKEQFVERSIAFHGDAYEYDRVVYVCSTEKVEIFCNKHQEYFWQTPKIHKTCKCPKCGREDQIEAARMDKEGFIKRVIEKHGDLFTFEKVEYINNKTHVVLTCKEGGDFITRPDTFLNRKKYIPKSKKLTKHNDKEIFIEKAKEVYGDKDDYTDTNVINSKYKVKVRCKTHNLEFEKSIGSYLGGAGCPECSAENYSLIRTTTLDEFISRANEIHNNRYEYGGDFKGMNHKVSIYCEEHGEFRQIGANHMAGTGCPKCAKEEAKYRDSPWTRTEYARLAGDNITMLYLIKCRDENEEFYKIGKTFKLINKRFLPSNLPYEFEVISKYYSNAVEIYDLEIEMHRKYKEYRHNTLKKFGGYSECYTLELPIEEIIALNKEECQKE